jgi:hypothetical protein
MQEYRDSLLHQTHRLLADDAPTRRQGLYAPVVEVGETVARLPLGSDGHGPHVVYRLVHHHHSLASGEDDMTALLESPTAQATDNGPYEHIFREHEVRRMMMGGPPAYALCGFPYSDDANDSLNPLCPSCAFEWRKMGESL